MKSPWIVAGVILALVVVAWLFVKGEKHIQQWLHEPVEPGKPRWTYALTPLAAALAPLAAFSALLPSYLRQQQSDRKFMAEAERSRSGEQWERARIDAQTQETQFADAQARFGSANAQTRAQAALLLGELALLPKPTGRADIFDDANYIHFATTSTQMALALQMEQNADVRAAISTALQRMTAFAAGKNAAWQHELANALASANRRTRQEFLRALAHHTAAHGSPAPSTLRTLATVAPFTSQTEVTAQTLRDLAATEPFHGEHRIATRQREAATNEQRRTLNSTLLVSVQASAAHLIDTRDALANALRALKPGTTPAKPATLADLASTVGQAPKAEEKHTLELADCFLAGADLRNADLSNADLSKTNLNGADLNGANLATASVETAILPPSVIGANFGQNTEWVERLKAKYPQYHWAPVEAGATRGKEGQLPKVP